nr:hypothetical protein [Tanacetum cinerariifolium]
FEADKLKHFNFANWRFCLRRVLGDDHNLGLIDRQIGLENYLSYELMAHLGIMFHKQAFEDLMQAIKFIKTCNIVRNDLLIKSEFLKCCLRDLREIGSPKVNLIVLGYLMGLVYVVNVSSDWWKFDNCLVKIHKLIVNQWELNKTVANVAKEIKRPKLEDSVPVSKCVHCGNIWNKALTSSSKSGLTESNGGKSNTAGTQDLRKKLDNDLRRWTTSIYDDLKEAHSFSSTNDYKQSKNDDFQESFDSVFKFIEVQTNAASSNLQLSARGHELDSFLGKLWLFSRQRHMADTSAMTWHMGVPFSDTWRRLSNDSLPHDSSDVAGAGSR